MNGSSQFRLQVAKLKVHSRLSIVSAAHHLLLLQLALSMNGVKPGRIQLQLEERRAGRIRVADDPELLSLSGLHGFCGYEFGSQIGSPNQGARLNSP